ncbi:MAG: cbb3-type cytochrome c oxidase subunit 3 [Wenzhouxiangellaceae bacterium]|nr:cbb3-type cytochrome c oxidase subunit 3 [Wenzhouxiangellaceae bacterium]
MTGGIITLLALLGFLAVVVWVFIVKRREDFDRQAHLPLEDRDDADNGGEQTGHESENNDGSRS